MTSHTQDPDEDDVPEMAVHALNAAHRRAIEAGYPLVLVEDGFLVRKDASGITVLKKLLPRKKATSRTRFWPNI